MTPAFQAAIASRNYQPIMMIEGLFDSGALRFWTGYGDLVWSGNTFIGSAQLIGITDVTETNALESSSVTFTLNGIPAPNLSFALTENYQNRVVNLYFGLLSNGALIADPVVLFRGRADSLTIRSTGDSADIRLVVENHLVDLMRARTRRYTHEDQQLDYAGDLGFQFVKDIQDKVYRFGPQN